MLTGEITGLGVTRMLEAVRIVDPEIRFYQASSSEMFGKVQRGAADRDDAVPPALARTAWPRCYGHYITVNYRETLRPVRLSAASCSTTRSPRRGLEFVTRKITDGVGADQARPAATSCALGNLDAQRDWGFAGDYVEAMWLMLQQDEPDDYVIATGETHSVREFVELAFAHVGLDWREARRARPALPPPGRGRPARSATPTKAQRRARLGAARSASRELVEMMVDADLERVANELAWARG